MKWINNIRHQDVISSSVEIGCFHLTVHHWVGCGDVWFMSCLGSFDRIELGDVPLGEAKVTALDYLEEKLKKALEEYK